MAMDETKIVDYFLVAGLPEKVILDREPLTSSRTPKLPIIDIALINKTQGEIPPDGYECLELTPTRYPANLNYGSLMSPEMYLCFKRGRNTPPIVDIGIMYQSDERQLKLGCEVITKTPYGRSANISNTSSEKIFINFCRAEDVVEWDTLAVSDVCVVLPGKGEFVPHAFHKIDKNLNLGMLGSDVYLCYRKSFIKNKCLTYDAELLFRYPDEDDPSIPLREQVPMFCLPLGATIERWCGNSRHPLPMFSTFVLTDQLGQKCYGASVVFYKDFDCKHLSREQQEFFDEDDGREGGVKNHRKGSSACGGEDKFIYQQNQSICLLSKWPFFDAFKKFLLYIYRISVSGPQSIPIERYISQFFNEIPFPSPERPYISIQLTNEEIVLVQPDRTPLPKSGASFSKFLINLGPDVCLSIFVCVLLEHKIAIHSIRPDLLTCVAETASTMIFPFTWQCPYVPLCPLRLSDIVDSPTPFIIGLDSCYFDSPDPPPPSDVTFIDLDAQAIKLSSERTGDTIKILPKKALKTLRTSLEELYDGLVNDPSCPGTPGDLDCHGSFNIRDALNQQNRRKVDMQIQECFLQFMTYVLKGYRSFLLSISDGPMDGEFDISALFDVAGFLKSHDKSYQKFLSEMLRTQYFCHFLEGRSLGSKENASLSYFDDCLQKLSQNPSATLIEVEERVLSERTAVISFHDNAKEIPGVAYEYNGFTHLKLELFNTTIHNVLPASKDSFLPPTRDLLKRPTISLSRSKQESRSAQKLALSSAGSPESMARCLLWSAYSLWFILLPSYVQKSPAKNLLLSLACRAMIDLIDRGGVTLDEVPYRIFFQLCGIYEKRRLAVKVYEKMRRHGITLDVTTYGYYNSAVIVKETKPSGRGMFLWRRLSLVVQGITRFKMGLLTKKDSVKSKSSSSGSSLQEFLNIFSKVGSPKLPGKSQFSRAGLRGSLMKKEKPKDVVMAKSDRKGMGVSFSPGETIRHLFVNEKKRLDLGSEGLLRQGSEMHRSCEELKIKNGRSTGGGVNSDSVEFDASRRTNSLASASQIQPSATNDSLSNLFQSVKQHYQNIQNKLVSPSKVSLDSQGNPTEPECSTLSCLAPDSNLSISSLSENADHLHETDASSISSSGCSTSLHKRNLDDSFACQFPHLSVDMTSQMKCSNCSSLLYDEQIMADWNLSDSDLNTKCYCCGARFVPRIRVVMKDVPPLGSHAPDDSTCADYSDSQFPSEFEVQYLNPLVVRKELENLFQQKGEDCIDDANLIVEHPIIFWNSLWHASKLGLPTHLKQMPLRLNKCQHINQVVARILWDSPHTHRDFGPPMHVLWKEIDATDINSEDAEASFNKCLLQRIISGVVSARIPIDLVLQERSRGRRSQVLHRDIFHDVLFLSMTALGQKTFDIDKFERQYELSYDALSVREKRKVMASDDPPREQTSWCRRLFKRSHIS